MTKDLPLPLILAAAASGAVALWCVLEFRRPKKHSIPAALLKSPYAAELKVAVRLALQAGRNIHHYSVYKAGAPSDLGITTKGQPEDFCTMVDLENEHLVTETLQRDFPSHKIIGEEATGTGPIPPLTKDPTWIVDPIDGTVNFANGLPLTCVSIGFCMEGKAVLGVVYAPMVDELYLAVLGCGAYLNHERLDNLRQTSLQDAIINYEFGYARSPDCIRLMTTAVQNVLQHGCRTTRCLGSGVLDLCYVASGRLDVVYAGVATEGWKPWDYCAASVIVQEAGAIIQPLIVQDGYDEGFDLYSKSVLCASSRELAEETRRVVLKNL